MELSIFFHTMKAFIEQFSYGCISPHCKRRQTQYSIHSEFSYIMECHETNLLFQSSSKLCDTTLELLQSRSLLQCEVSVYGCAGRGS